MVVQRGRRATISEAYPLGYVERSVATENEAGGIFSSRHSVWTSTDKTGGRSRTIGVQLSPASADPYTCPPDVPK